MYVGIAELIFADGWRTIGEIPVRKLTLGHPSKMTVKFNIQKEKKL